MSANDEDRNFYSRRPVAAPASQSPHHQNYESLSPNSHQTTSQSPLLRSPDLPPKLPFLTTKNLQAATANAFDGALNGGDGDPDDFYRGYSGVQPLARGHTNNSSNDMATTTSEARPLPTFSRSSGHGTTSRHATPQIVARNSLRTTPAYRSASAPVVDVQEPASTRFGPALTIGSNGKPSVKEMTKQFDTQSKNSISTTRRPVAPVMASNGCTISPGYTKGHQARATTGTSETTAISRGEPSSKEPGMKSPAGFRPPQRTRLVTEGQHSDNRRSGVARPTQPRKAVAGNVTLALRSIGNLSPTSPTSPVQLPTQRPLFGEVLAPESGGNISYGIPHTATRRTSESSLHPPRSTHLRSRSDHTNNIDPVSSSATDWYKGVTPNLENVESNRPSNPTSHRYTPGGLATTKSDGMYLTPRTFKSSINPDSSLPKTAKSLSRLPVRTRQTPSDNSSPASSLLSHSPPPTKSMTKGIVSRAEERPWSPAARSTTPTTHTRLPGPRTPPARTSSRGKTCERELPSSSLAAIVSSPPLKTSPPLRSSRPRQPVSSAATASSRLRATERAGSPYDTRPGMKVVRNHKKDRESERERNVDDRPVDWATKRTTIQRAHTETLSTMAQEQVRAANLERLRERERVEREAREAELKPESTMPEDPPPDTVPGLTISTSFPQRIPPVDTDGIGSTTDLDSPTLGIPGSFVDDDEAPASAISNVTGTTDFDNEPQTEPATMRFNEKSLSTQVIEWDMLSPEQASHGVRNSVRIEDGTIQMMLDDYPAEEAMQESTPTNDAYYKDSSPPGAFKRDSEYASASYLSHSTSNGAHPKLATEPGSTIVQVTQIFQPANSQETSNVKDKLLHNRQTDPRTPESETFPLSEHTPLASESSGSKNVREHLSASATDMGYESSDGYGAPSASRRESYSNGNTLQQDSRPDYQPRNSHQSTWTDCSVDNGERYLSRPPVSPILNLDSTQSIPMTEASTSFSTNREQHRLPPVTIGEEFAIVFPESSPAALSKSASNLTNWPDYAPPPPPSESQEISRPQTARYPPLSNFNNGRPPSSVYQSSLNGASRQADSRRNSDELYSLHHSLTTTPRSSAQISLEDTNAGRSTEAVHESVTEEERLAAEALAKQLRTRRHVIQELIDTESSYVRDMNVVEEIYKGTAEACTNLGGNDIKSIFRNTKELINFNTEFLECLKHAAVGIYSPTRPNKRGQSKAGKAVSSKDLQSAGVDRLSVAATSTEQTDTEKDALTFVGSVFWNHLDRMQAVYTEFLKTQELASSRLTALQADAGVKVWLDECNWVAKDLTTAWDLDALLVKPLQRITRYSLLLNELIKHTPEYHHDLRLLHLARDRLTTLLTTINETKARIDLVDKIVRVRPRKESEVRTGLAKRFGFARADKMQSFGKRPDEDPEYTKAHELYTNEYLQLQVILRDVEFYTRTTANNVNEFLRFLSAMELVMRLSPSSSPEIESKWVRFNMHMRDMGTIALNDHISAVRRTFVEPLERLIELYGPPQATMKKRAKRRFDYEKSVLLKAAGKRGDSKFMQLVLEYNALNETLKLDLPKLSKMTKKICKMCITQFHHLQVRFYQVWEEKVQVVFEAKDVPRSLEDILDAFQREYTFAEAKAHDLAMLHGTFLDTASKNRVSQSTTGESKSRPSNLSSRSRGLSINSDRSPSLPTPNFANRDSGQFTFSPLVASTPNNPLSALPTQSLAKRHSRNGSGSPATPEVSSGDANRPQDSYDSNLARPSTGRSSTSDSGAMPRASNDYTAQNRRESGSTHNSGYHVDGPFQSAVRPFSGLFHSAMPLSDVPVDGMRSSRASSRDRHPHAGYNILYLAASLFEFNISSTKQEAGYPYLTYQAGEIFDVIGEKGELWLAKNQDDSANEVGWIWSKHFARLATD